MPAGSTSKSTSKPRRRGPKHPGVVLIRPDVAARTGWRARYRDPDSGRMVKVTLEQTLSTAELRGDWAARKSKALAKRRLELEAGAPPNTRTAVPDAVRRYFDAHRHLKPRTLEIYKKGTDPFLAFCEARRIRSCDDLTSARLVAFSDSRAKVLKHAVAAGRRGAKRETEELRSPMTVNQELRGLATVLEYLRRAGLLPKLSSDGIRDGLRRMKAIPRPITFMRSEALQSLLSAALKHDAATFTETRAEHASRLGIGTTPRHSSIAPCIALAILTGLRFQHLLALEWQDCDLAMDEGGKPCGFVAPRSSSLTKRCGTIDLSIAPALHALLCALKRQARGRQRVLTLAPDEAKAALRRLLKDYDAPADSGWQVFRRSCGCYLANAPSLFGGASAWRAAKWLGHGVQVSERHYLDLVRVPRDAKTLEAAMGVEKELARIVAAVCERDQSRAAAE